MKAPTLAAAVAGGGAGIQGGTHVPVLDGQGDQTAWSAGNVPGQSATQTAQSQVSVRVRRHLLVGQAVGDGFLVDPRDEVLDASAEAAPLERTTLLALANDVVVGGAEQQLAPGDHLFQHPDSVHYRHDRDPRDRALLTGGDMVAVGVADVLVVMGADQMPRHRAVRVRLRVGAAPGAQGLGLLGRIPVKYKITIAAAVPRCRTRIGVSS